MEQNCEMMVCLFHEIHESVAVLYHENFAMALIVLLLHLSLEDLSEGVNGERYLRYELLEDLSEGVDGERYELLNNTNDNTS